MSTVYCGAPILMIFLGLVTAKKIESIGYLALPQ
jgi:hypothetical protein